MDDVSRIMGMLSHGVMFCGFELFMMSHAICAQNTGIFVRRFLRANSGTVPGSHVTCHQRYVTRRAVCGSLSCDINNDASHLKSHD